MHKMKCIGFLMLAMMFCVAFNGCMINVKNRTTQVSSGRPLTKNKIDKITPGITTKEWILDTFGLPTREKQLENGVEILEYERSTRSDSDVTMFILLSVDNSETTKQVLTVKIKDGIVQKYWLD